MIGWTARYIYDRMHNKIMYAKAITIALATIFLTLPLATAQIVPIKPSGEIKPTDPFVNLFKIPVNSFFSVIFALGSVPLYIIRGFLRVWSSWGFPSIQEILSSFSLVAPAVFRDAMPILLFFGIVEFVILFVFPVPVLGLAFIPLAWGLTGTGVLLFAIADFISKINSITVNTEKEKTGGAAGWWV